MKNIIKLFVTATAVVLSSTAYATAHAPIAYDTKPLFSADEIHHELKVNLAENIDAIKNQAVPADLTMLIAQTQLESELNQFIQQAKNDLPKNRFRVVFAD